MASISRSYQSLMVCAAWRTGKQAELHAAARGLRFLCSHCFAAAAQPNRLCLQPAACRRPGCSANASLEPAAAHLCVSGEQGPRHDHAQHALGHILGSPSEGARGGSAAQHTCSGEGRVGLRGRALARLGEAGQAARATGAGVAQAGVAAQRGEEMRVRPAGARKAAAELRCAVRCAHPR